jgi:tripartite ATP-independent transporter DctM subunit
MLPGVLVVVFLFILIFLSVPIAFALVVAAAVVMLTFGDIDLWNMVSRCFSGMSNFPLQAIPFFMFTGLMMNASGITDGLIKLSDAVVGRFRGGLAQINVLVSMLFAGNSGSSASDVSGIGSILMPAMVKKGYSKDLTVTVTAASATLAAIIPPSIMMVIYGSILGVSVGKMFLGGVIPGIMVGLLQMLLVYFYAVKFNLPREKKYSLKEFLSALKGGLPTVGIPVLVIGGILGGFVTATEAGLISAVYSIFLGCVVYRTIDWQKLVKVMKDTVIMTSLILFCIGTATVFSYVIAYYKLPLVLQGFIQNTSFTHAGFLFMVSLTFLIVGTFLDATPAMLVFMPIFAPAADSLGINPILLGLVSIITLALGQITPPYGLCLLIGSKIVQIPPERCLKTLSVFILGILSVVVLIIFIPQLVLWLPSIFIK